MRGPYLGLSCLIVTLGATIGCQTPSTSIGKIDKVDNRVVAARHTVPVTARLQSPRPKTKDNESSSLINELPASLGDESDQEVAVRIKAMVNGKPIFEQEVVTASFQELQSTIALPEPARSRKQNEIRKKTLEDLIDLEIVIQDAAAKLEKLPEARKRIETSAADDFENRFVKGMVKGNQLKTRDQLDDFLSQRGLSLGLMKRQWVRRIISQEFLRSQALRTVKDPTRRELYDYYLTNSDEFEVKDSVDWQDIFISVQKHGTREKAKAVAEDLVRQIRGGADFVTLCKKYDDGVSALSGGKGAGTQRGEIHPAELETLLFQMEDGQVANPVEFENGYHVVRMVKRQVAGVQPFDEKVQQRITTKLRGQVAGREMKRIVNRLRRQAIIEYAR